jgi:DNA-binding response OmpR family regulator
LTKNNSSNNNVLLLDDDPLIIEFLASVFDDYGINYEHSGEIIPALELISRNEYKMIFVDISIQGKDGRSLAHTLSERISSPPLVLFTGRSKAWVAKNFHKDIKTLHKPFHIDELLEFLKEQNIIDTV